jgi:hypothetical protein
VLSVWTAAELLYLYFSNVFDSEYLALMYVELFKSLVIVSHITAE